MSVFCRDWSTSPVSDRVWAQALHAVVERRVSLRQASQDFGLQQSALHRLVRQHTLRQLRHAPSSPDSSTSPSKNDKRPLSLPTTSSCGVTSNDRYVFPQLNSLVLGQRSPNGGQLPSVVPITAVMTPPLFCELTPELNDEIVSVLREQFVQQYEDYKMRDGRYHRLEGYADADIVNVVRTIVGRNGRSALPTSFPSQEWLTIFKRENDFAEVDEVGRCDSRSRAGSGNSLEGLLSSHQLSQSQNCEREQHQRYDMDHQNNNHWVQKHNYRQTAALPPSSPLQLSPVQLCLPYTWEDANKAGNPMLQQNLRSWQLQLKSRGESSFSQSRSPDSSNGRAVHSDSNSSDRNYRQSNLVPAKVWEAAMEDVAIHGMSLRNAAKVHGVHFAALHRRLKKRQQYKLNTPCEPDYIPFEDEAGIVRVIHARADMGVLLTFTELVDLLKRTALKHRSSLSEDVGIALVRKFQSRVEQSIRHLILDWPTVANNVLYLLRDMSDSEIAHRDDMAASSNATTNNVPATSSGPRGQCGSESSSGSLSSLSSWAASLPMMQKSKSAQANSIVYSKNPSSASSEETDNSSSSCSDDSNGSGGHSSPAKVSFSKNELASKQQPCIILRL
ncbi:hypothetical protein CCR75_009762 [Bremia lactucae]|uniref:HTH psq-type domain-containing protein n=1 Tax=Bremia lactucae TaxID=4779 RepID=A0A976IJ58_BRELC|nr:hypothetical protein CCR75_009762 [Bremia lactucae]